MPFETGVVFTIDIGKTILTVRVNPQIITVIIIIVLYQGLCKHEKKRRKENNIAQSGVIKELYYN
jgi:hypothetical protein